MHVRSGAAEWKNAGLTALATAVCYWITLAFNLRGGYWALITCIVVMQSEVGATLLASRDRLIGTAIGALTGWVAELAWRDPHSGVEIFVLCVAVWLAVGLCNILHLESAGRLAGVAVVIVVLLHGTEPAWNTALSRFFEVSLGVLVALVITGIFYPRTLLTEGVKMAVKE